MSNIGLNNGTEQTHPLLENVRKSPLTAALMSKLVEAPKNVGSVGIRDTAQGAEASMGEAFSASMKIQREIQNSENALVLFPDIELSKQILITGVLSPNNTLSQVLRYLVNHPLLPSDVANKIVKIVEEEVDGYYKISQDLYKILEDALFDKGSHIRLVLPESAVDELINEKPNIRFESVNDVQRLYKTLEPKSTGILGPYNDTNAKIRFESADFGSHGDPKLYVDDASFDCVEFTDNFYTLREAPLRQTFVEQALKDKFTKVRSERYAKLRSEKKQKIRGESVGVAIPAQSNNSAQNSSRFHDLTISELKDSELKSALFKSNNRGVSLFARVPDRDTLKRYSIGRPLHMEIPAEAFIPIHYPGDPERAVGGFALTDQSGYFLTMESQKRYLDSMEQNYNATSSTASGSGGASANLSSSLLAKARRSLGGGNDNVPLTHIAEIFNQIMEENIIKRAKNGVYGLEMALSSNTDAYAISMARSFAGQTTRMVYIPKSFFTYFAFQFNPNGTGRSLLTDVKYLISLRAVSLYAKVANQIRNAISVTDIKVKLDPRDNNPQKTLEKVADVVSQTRSQFFPWGLNTPSDISNWWQRAGFQLNVEEHPKLPNTKVDYEFRNHDKGTPDIDDDGVLNDMIHMHFGITPEMRDAGQGADFATSIANNNILFSKRVHRLQDTFNTDLSDYVRVIALNDAHIYDAIRDVVEESWGSIVTELDDHVKTLAETDKDKSIEFFTDEVIASLSAELPSPRVNRLKQQIEAFNEFVDALDAVFESVMSDDSLSEKFFQVPSENIKALLPAFKAQIVRDWMLREDFLTDIFDLSSVTNENEPDSKIMDAIPVHLKNIGVNITKFIKELQKYNVALTTDMQNASGQGGEGGEGGEAGGSGEPPMAPPEEESFS